MKILMGIYTKDEGGEIIFNGQPYHVSNPKEAMDHGVAMIHQELNPILDMSVYENIFVGRELRKNGLVDAKTEIAEAEKLIKECGLHVSPKEAAQPHRCTVPIDRDHQGNFHQRQGHCHGRADRRYHRP